MTWRMVLIDSYCQAGKTKKCFEILANKIALEKRSLVLYVTQANSLGCAHQTLQRAKEFGLVPNVHRSAMATIGEGHHMLVDFWHSKNMAHMMSFVQKHHLTFSSLIVVIDECEQGNLNGLKERLAFVLNLEGTVPIPIKLIFMTATIANLSKSILQIAKADLRKFKAGIVADVIYRPLVEHHFAVPHSTYVGASWFLQSPNVWRRLDFPRRTGEMTKAQYAVLKLDAILAQIHALPSASKELSLIVTSTRVQDHFEMAERLYFVGYNVTVILNGTNSKDFIVQYVNSAGRVKEWAIPYNEIDARADSGDLKTFRDAKRKLVRSEIHCRHDYTMSHVLQAALFMMTDAETRIQTHVSPKEYNKLDALVTTIAGFRRPLRRPDDYPERPRVALIAGMLAGRGITFQNPDIDFTCTSFCFAHTQDGAQRGATNTQRFGRACGMLGEVYTRDDRRPILIATEGILRSALANEAVLKEKAEKLGNGTRVALKDLVTQREWAKIMIQTRVQTKKVKVKVLEENIDGVKVSKLKHWFESETLLVGRMIRYLYEVGKPVTFEAFKRGVNYEKSDQQFKDNIDSGRSIGARYGKLWNIKDSLISINTNLIKFLS